MSRAEPCCALLHHTPSSRIGTWPSHSHWHCIPQFHTTSEAAHCPTAHMPNPPNGRNASIKRRLEQTHGITDTDAMLEAPKRERHAAAACAAPPALPAALLPRRPSPEPHCTYRRGSCLTSLYRQHLKKKTRREAAGSGAVEEPRQASASGRCRLAHCQAGPSQSDAGSSVNMLGLCCLPAGEAGGRGARWTMQSPPGRS